MFQQPGAEGDFGCAVNELIPSSFAFHFGGSGGRCGDAGASNGGGDSGWMPGAEPEETHSLARNHAWSLFVLVFR